MSLFKNRIYEHFNVNFFKSEVSDTMSAKGAHVEGASGSEPMNSPVPSSPHSPIIDTKYVFISNCNYYLKHYTVDGYYFIFIFMRIFSKLNLG